MDHGSSYDSLKVSISKYTMCEPVLHIFHGQKCSNSMLNIYHQQDASFHVHKGFICCSHCKNYILATISLCSTKSGIFCRYAKSDFILDVLSCLPWDVIYKVRLNNHKMWSLIQIIGFLFPFFYFYVMLYLIFVTL